MKIQKIFETPPLPPFGTAVPTTPTASWSSVLRTTFIFAKNFILHDALDAVKRSARDKIKILQK